MEQLACGQSGTEGAPVPRDTAATTPGRHRAASEGDTELSGSYIFKMYF